MGEKIFLSSSIEGQSVQVTNARFIVGNQTYAMSGVTSVKAGSQPKKIGGPVILVLLGILLMAAGSILVGVLILALGVFISTLAKATYTVVLSSSSGELTALSGHTEDDIASVVRALNQSIIYRS